MNSTQRNQEAFQMRLTNIIDRINWADDGETPPTLRDIYLISTGAMCTACEAQLGDNDYCIFDGSPHEWAVTGQS